MPRWQLHAAQEQARGAAAGWQEAQDALARQAAREAEGQQARDAAEAQGRALLLQMSTLRYLLRCALLLPLCGSGGWGVAH